MAHPNADLVREAYDLFSKGDMATLQTLWTSDIAWHVGGSGRLVGDYEGPAAILGLFGELVAATEGTFKVELQSVFADDNEGFSLHKATAHKGGEHYELWAVLSYRFVDGKTAEVWNFDYDQTAAEKLVA